MSISTNIPSNGYPNQLMEKYARDLSIILPPNPSIKTVVIVGEVCMAKFNDFIARNRFASIIHRTVYKDLNLSSYSTMEGIEFLINNLHPISFMEIREFMIKYMVTRDFVKLNLLSDSNNLCELSGESVPSIKAAEWYHVIFRGDDDRTHVAILTSHPIKD